MRLCIISADLFASMCVCDCIATVESALCQTANHKGGGSWPTIKRHAGMKGLSLPYENTSLSCGPRNTVRIINLAVFQRVV